MTGRLTVDGGGSGGRARLHGIGDPITVRTEAPLSLATAAPAVVARRLSELVDALPATADVRAISVGLAGGSASTRSGAARAGLRPRWPHARLTVGRDIDLVVSQLDAPGAGIVVGTGVVVIASAPPEAEVIVDGHGFAVGDRGGGAWIGLEAVRAALAAFDHEGVERPLLIALRRALRLPGGRGFAAALSEAGGLSARRIAGLAPVVVSLSVAGDEDARAIVERAVREVALSASAALRQAGLQRGAELVVAGGLATAPGFAQPLEAALRSCDAVEAVRRVDPLDGDLVKRR